MNAFQRRVKQALDEEELKPVSAALSVGLNRVFILDIVNGTKASVRGENLKKVAEALRRTPEWLLSDPDADVDTPPQEIQCKEEKREFDRSVYTLAYDYAVKFETFVGYTISPDDFYFLLTQFYDYIDLRKDQKGGWSNLEYDDLIDPEVRKKLDGKGSVS